MDIKNIFVAGFSAGAAVAGYVVKNDLLMELLDIMVPY